MKGRVYLNMRIGDFVEISLSFRRNFVEISLRFRGDFDEFSMKSLLKTM